MRIPFRRRKAEPVVSRELAASLGVALAAADREPDVKPKAEPVIHLHVDGAAGLSVACGSRTIGRSGVAMWITDPYAVTCGACKRTRIYKTRTSPGATAAPGTTRKQES